MLNEDKFNEEVKLGAKAANLHKSFLKEFCENKRVLLFDAFLDAEIRDTEALVTIKLQLNALNSMEQEIIDIIQTGNLAHKTLADNEEKEDESST